MIIDKLLEQGPIGIVAAMVLAVVYFAFTRGMSFSIKTGTKK